MRPSRALVGAVIEKSVPYQRFRGHLPKGGYDVGQDGQIEKLDWDGHVLGRAGTGPGNGVGQFGESNFMAMDAKGDIYVEDTVYGRVEKLIKKK